MDSKVYARPNTSWAGKASPPSSHVSDNLNLKATPSSVAVRAKVNSIAQTGSLKARGLDPVPPTGSSARSPSPQRISRTRSHSTLSVMTSSSVPSLRSPSSINYVDDKSSRSRPHTGDASTIPSPSSITLSQLPKSRLGYQSSNGRISPIREGPDNQTALRIKSKVTSTAKTRPLAAIFPQGGSLPSSSILGLDTAVSRKERAEPRKTRAVSPVRFQTYSPISSVPSSTLSSTTRSSSPIPRDPVSVPLPPHSPPGSTVSFASQSTASLHSPSSEMSSLSEARARGRSGVLQEEIVTTNTVADGSEHGEVEGGEDASRNKATAKSNRKIADLEITNKSLLVINANLESTKRRLSKEVHELRMKLRETRLALPPPRFRALQTSEPNFVHLAKEEVESGDEGIEEMSEEEEGRLDETFERVSKMVQTLIAGCQQALEKTGGAAVPRVQVLHADEIQDEKEKG